MLLGFAVVRSCLNVFSGRILEVKLHICTTLAVTREPGVIFPEFSVLPPVFVVLHERGHIINPAISRLWVTGVKPVKSQIIIFLNF